MTPNSATRRDTSPDRYISHPSISPVPIPSMKPGPSRNVQFLMAMSDLPTTTSDAAVRADRVLPQRHDGKDAEDADQDERALDEASDDVAEGDGFVLLLEQREQHDGAAHVGDDEQQLEERTDEHARCRRRHR